MAGTMHSLCENGRRDALLTAEEGAHVGQKTRLQLKVKIWSMFSDFLFPILK